MKKQFLLIFFAALLILDVYAQAPQKMTYQAVIRDAANVLVTNKAIGMRISILQTSITGSAVYVETQKANTNSNGLLTLEIGTGVSLQSKFDSVKWSNGSFYIKLETDPLGGTNYSITSTSQLLSVPYALYAENVKAGTSVGEMTYWDGKTWVAVKPGKRHQTLTYCSGVPTWGPCPLAVGDSYQGGKIAYIYVDGDPGYVVGEVHGLIVAPYDTTRFTWCNGCTVLNAKQIGSTSTAIGTGKSNTTTIVSNQGNGVYAAKYCDDLIIDGYTDWFLPSENELKKIFSNPIFTGSSWSSTESNWLSAKIVVGTNSIAFPKLEKNRVVTVRYF